MAEPGSSLFEARGLAVTSNGDIVIGGMADSNLAAARLLPSGRRDPSFGTDGVADVSAVNQGEVWRRRIWPCRATGTSSWADRRSGYAD